MSQETESTTYIWLTCNGKGCKETFGNPKEPLMRNEEPYSDWHEHDLHQDAKEWGWKFVGVEDEFGHDFDVTYCPQCALEKGLVPLTPIQQAALMHGRKVVIR